MAQVTITKIPLLNSVVIKQHGIHLFLSAPDSIIIDKDGLLQLIFELGKIDFIDTIDLRILRERLSEYYMEEFRKEINENKKDTSNSSIG